MAPLKEWLKPPRSLLVILFLLTLVSVSALGWFGWKLLNQDRLVEAQRSQEVLEQTADRASATLRRTLAETGERLGSWLAGEPLDPPADGLLLFLGESGMTAAPPERLLYQPVPSSLPEAPPALFAMAEAFEFHYQQPRQAAQQYEELAGSHNRAVAAGALLRLCRVLRNSGQGEQSRLRYAQLADMTGVKVAGAPADLVARKALCELTGRHGDAAALSKDLLRGRWQLTRGQFAYYWAEAARLSGGTAPPPAEAIALSEAAGEIWLERQHDPDVRGQRTVWQGGRPFFVMWRGGMERRAVLLTGTESILKQVFAGEQAFSRGQAFCAAVDNEGRVVAGHKDGTVRAAVRTAAENQLPWTLYVTGMQGLKEAGVPARQRYLMLGTLVMVLFLIAGTYFIARAIRREMEVSRMQSEFVSAVSHEFRSPLTSIRQLSEILAFGRAPHEERRQVYYDTLVRETVRLQRLVEALLNFGRMEAGARQYRFEELDAAALVHRVAAEFEAQIAVAGRHIELRESPAECRIEADPEAMSVALRNLLDNALKYSPDQPTVWVEWGLDRECVAIRVRDKGLGVQASERKAIFRKFVRGSAAAAGNVKGSGVGLAMVRHIVMAHGGEVTVESQPGQGSTFTLLLPAMGKA
jgi:signal transduction histidine kinase